jgi:F0F1-type ATP synthase assembly protein I
MFPNNDEHGLWGRLWRDAWMALTLGWELALPIFIGVFAGRLLDRWLGMHPVFTMGLLVAGVAMGYYNIMRFNQKLNQREDEVAAEAQGEDDA